MIASLANLQMLIVLAGVMSVGLVVADHRDCEEEIAVRGEINAELPEDALDSYDPYPRLDTTPISDEELLAREKAIESARSGCFFGPMPYTGAIERLLQD